jgi:hypothetical protein
MPRKGALVVCMPVDVPAVGCKTSHAAEVIQFLLTATYIRAARGITHIAKRLETLRFLLAQQMPGEQNSCAAYT